VIVTASGNSMRPIIRFFDPSLDDAATAAMEIPLCTPYIYTFEGDKMTRKEVRPVPGIVTGYAWKPESAPKA
jgi:bisphosphoglycerate-dependent phosphoglycerate mutase